VRFKSGPRSYLDEAVGPLRGLGILPYCGQHDAALLASGLHLCATAEAGFAAVAGSLAWRALRGVPR